jgi:hypothetical protein
LRYLAVEIRVLLFLRFQFCILTRQLLLHERMSAYYILRFKICITLLQRRDLRAQTNKLVLERPAVRVSANRCEPRNFHPISDPRPATTPAFRQVNRFVVIPGLD